MKQDGCAASDQRPHKRNHKKPGRYRRHGRKQHSEGKDRHRAGCDTEHGHGRIGMSGHHADQGIQDRGVSCEGEAKPREGTGPNREMNSAAPTAFIEEVAGLDDEQCGEEIRCLVDASEKQRVIGDGCPQPHRRENAGDCTITSARLPEQQCYSDATEQIGADLGWPDRMIVPREDGYELVRCERQHIEPRWEALYRGRCGAELTCRNCLTVNLSPRSRRALKPSPQTASPPPPRTILPAPTASRY